MLSQKKKPASSAVVLSLLGFVLLWAVVTDAWGYSGHLPVSHGGYVYACLSRLVWVAPAIGLIVRYDGVLYYGKAELFSRPVLNKSLAVALAVSAAYALGAMLAAHHGFRINRDLPSEAVKTVVVGFVEETVFRGWGYNALRKATTDKKAMAYSTAFFILLHWPAYFVRLFRFGAFDVSAWMAQSLTAAIWGVAGCVLLKRGKTLWNPIIAHTVYDAALVLFVG